MSYSDQMIDGQDPLVSARAALHFDYPDTASAQVFALIAIAEELRKLNQPKVQPPITVNIDGLDPTDVAQQISLALGRVERRRSGL